MENEKKYSDKQILKLQKMLSKNQDIDIRRLSFQDQDSLTKLKWAKKQSDKRELIDLLKAYQRLLRIIPGNNMDVAFSLLQLDIDSAVQIASMPKQEFLKKTAEVFGQQLELTERVYQNAILRRSQVVVQYMDVLQNSEPHVKAARV